MVVIDGSYGEGGGQILRTSLSLSIILKQPIRLKNIRTRRKTPGLAAQHLTAVRAAATICEATLTGDELGSTGLLFEPRAGAIPGIYHFDVTEARPGGSAGAASLVLQTVLLPLAVAPGPSTVTVRGGTHVAWSPSFHYLAHVFLPMVAQLGFEAALDLEAWGWYPAGEGEIKAHLAGGALVRETPPNPAWLRRGPLKAIEGLAVAANLPAHIPQRMVDRAQRRLAEAGQSAKLTAQRVRAVSAGAGLFLTAIYESSRAGFSALGRVGKVSEAVADEAVEALLDFHEQEVVLDRYLTDQLILPLVLTRYQGSVSTEILSEHTLTNIWVVRQFLGPVVQAHEADNVVEFLPA
ncbi:MAG TPA: RNA 3'-terminal phosphate cyclase [Anaerolineae bacterium]|nr:RNA 3'-terminal phosphate cyclase [Anaerolineae bacterium]